MFKNRKQTDPRIENDKSNLISRIVKEDRQVTHISSIRVQAHLYNSKYEQRSDEWFFNMFQLLEEGIETADEELKSEPDNIETLYRKMTNLELLERMDEADKVAEDILSLNPKDRRQMMLKADVLSGKGQYNDAVELFKEAEKMKSYDDAPLAKVVHHLRYGEHDQALEICNNLLEIEQNPKVYYVRAYFYTVIGNFEQALEDIDSVISFTTGCSSEWNLKGLILEKMGYRLEAKGCFLYNKGVDVDNLMADIHLI